MINFTRRELTKAYRTNYLSYIESNGKTSNAHRLLLFYASECGLKALYLKRNGLEHTDGCGELTTFKHDINKMLDALRSGIEHRLPTAISLKPYKDNGKEVVRNATPASVNQVWRYGAAINNPSDEEIEKKLTGVCEWIKGELS